MTDESAVDPNTATGQTHVPLPPQAHDGSAPITPPSHSPDGAVQYTPAASPLKPMTFGVGPDAAAAERGEGPEYVPIHPPKKPYRTVGGRKVQERSWFVRWLQWRTIIVAAGLAISFIVAVRPGQEIPLNTLEAGDCFDASNYDPEGDDLNNQKLTIQDCSEPHGAEVFAIVSGEVDTLLQTCTNALVAAVPEGPDSLPEDFRLSVLFFADPERNRCVIDSASGQLIGSIYTD